MSTRLRRFTLPRGTLGDLREFILEQLVNEELLASLGNITDKNVDLLLSVCGDNLQSLNTLMTETAFSLDGTCTAVRRTVILHMM